MNTEKAYNKVANILYIHFSENEVFDKLELIIELDDGFIGRQANRYFNNEMYMPTIDDISFEAEADLQSAANFLKDNLIETTGDKIWGFTFTLYPDGQFNIDYTYDMPEWMQDD